MDPRQIHLDNAGPHFPSHPIHKNLGGLQPGPSAAFCPKDSKIEIHDQEGRLWACLTKEGARRGKDRLDRIVDARALTMLQRTRDDPGEGFQGRIHSDAWELPMIEVLKKI